MQLREPALLKEHAMYQRRAGVSTYNIRRLYPPARRDARRPRWDVLQDFEWVLGVLLLLLLQMCALLCGREEDVVLQHREPAFVENSGRSSRGVNGGTSSLVSEAVYS